MVSVPTGRQPIPDNCAIISWNGSHTPSYMSGIDRIIILDARHLAKHLPGTAATNRLLHRGRAAHVFNDEATLLRVAEVIIEQGTYTGFARGYDRYGLLFSDATVSESALMVQPSLYSMAR
jgi:hypothetical protein